MWFSAVTLNRKFCHASVGMMRANIYFSKNHAYRHGLFNVVDSAVLDYNLGTAVGAEDFGATQCYRNMAPFYGYGAVNEADYFTTLQASNYKWAFGYGAGNYGSISGVGVTANFASAGRQVRSIFNVFYGSYFTDFDNSNNFLKAAIAPYGSSLISVAGGRPNLFLQSMAMGKSIGYSVQESQNNLDVAFSTQLFTFYGYGTRFVTTSLLGDPTLRLDYVNPVSNITFCRDSIQSDTLRVFWHSPNNETSIDSYYVYRGDQVLDSFAFVGSTADTFYFDTATQKTKVYYYMIRASKLDSNCSGNYFNLSQGVCAFTSYMEKDSFSDTLSLCLGDSIQIGRSINESEEGQNYTYTWSPNSFIVDSSSHRTMAFPVSNTLYILETKDKMGITAYDTFLVEIDTLPSNGITVTNQSVSCGDTVTMISNPAPTSGLFYTWTFNNATPGTTSGATSNGPHPVIFDSSGSQQVNLDITYNFGTCTYQDSIGVIINCTTLPIDLLAFEANKEGDNIRLNWQTASEWNNHFFTILRSLDGVNFEPISKVYSKATGGNSISLLNYNYLDSKVPNNSIIYYKLMQQDYNGAQEQSNIVTVNQDLLQSISPNPFNEFIILNGFGEVKNVELFSINGIMVKSINNPKGSIDTKNLPLGFYLIKIKTVSGVYSEKLIKQ